VNVTIVGAGIVGCAIAHELASRGARVRVLDVRGTGMGATHASAGILAPHIEGHLPSLLQLCVRSFGLYDAFIERLRNETDQPIEYERAGTLQVASNGAELEHLREQTAVLSSAGVAHSMLTARDLQMRSVGPSQLADGLLGGLLIPEQGYVVVPALVNALTVAAAKHGTLFSHERVLRVKSNADGAQVITMDGTSDADAVVVAAGAWSPEVVAAKAWPPYVKPIRGQLLQLRGTQRAASHVVWGSGCYVVPWQNGTALVGATVEDVGFHETATAEGIQGLLSAATSMLPSLGGASFEGVRVGLRPMAGDELPIIGPSSNSPRVFYATGHYRNGILLAPLTASIVADYVLEKREAPELAITKPSRFGL